MRQMERTKKVNRLYFTPDGQKLKATAIDKFFRDVVTHQVGETLDDGGKKTITVYDGSNPLQGTVLQPGPDSPICRKCGLDQNEARHPYLDYRGPDAPLLTVIFDSVSKQEDANGVMASTKAAAWLRNAVMKPIADKIGFDLEQIRWVPLTRCANWLKAQVNYRVKANWCRLHAIQDLMLHPPKLIMPVGTVALGALCHKSNAQDWGGRLLTYRGWPDDWLMDKKYCLPRPDPANAENKVIGHPLFGPPPENQHTPMFPVQTPRLVLATQNPRIKERFRKQVERALKLVMNGVTAKSYIRPWYRITDDVEEIESILGQIIEHPGLELAYDTETKGLDPWHSSAAIVFMMFRWDDPVSGEPRSIGFPWNYTSLPGEPPNRVRAHTARLRPLVLKALTQSTVICHNSAFDVLHTIAQLMPAWVTKHPYGSPDYNRAFNRHVCALADAAKADTWHMAYTARQQRGTLGLEAIAYDYAPDLAGYEEEMTILINLHYDEMHPEAGKGGHYANCPKSKWKTHLEPYVMGDVEVTRQAHTRIKKKLETSTVYAFPLADPARPGRFRDFESPGRDWVYTNVMSPASRQLIKMMARGLFVSLKELAYLEHQYPTTLEDRRKDLIKTDPKIIEWCQLQKRAEGQEWELDLESKDQLKEVLFNQLKLPIQRFTKAGKQFYGEDPAKWDSNIRDEIDRRLQGKQYTEQEFEDLVWAEKLNFAALDKFTLNKLAVDYEHVRPLQEYRRVFKLYTAYVKPMRTEHLHLPPGYVMPDEPDRYAGGLVHASFMMTGTRGGRLSCRNPNLQQLPRKGDVKKMFISRFGKRGCLLNADLSQIELRLLAAASGDVEMVKAYHNNVDIHTLTASRIFNLPYETFSKEHFAELQEHGKDKEAKDLNEKRTTAKTTNFLTGYGGGAFGLQTVLANNSIYLSLERCEEIIQSFFESYPTLRRHLQLYKQFIQDTGKAVSVFGRVRIFDEVFGNDNEEVSKALRAGCNHLIQSTASDMMLIALMVIESMMREEDLESMLVSTVHDSLLIDCIQNELPKVYDIVTLVLNNFDQVLPAVFGDDYDTSWMTVPFAGDCEVGKNYHDLRTVPAENQDWDKLLNE